MYERIEENNKGLLGTILFHVVIVLLIIFLGFTTPLPLPDEEGILINFGTEQDGLGFFEPSQPSVSQPASVSQPVSSEEPDILTQEIEEAPAITPPKPQPQPEAKQEPEKKPEPVETKTVEQPKVEEVPERQVNQRALYPGRTTTPTTSQSEGVTTGTGNQGSPVGSPDSGSRVGSDSQGDKGISFSLEGRIPVSLPKPDYNIQQQGIVVVEVTVDKQGNVTQAIPGVRGSTTINEYLMNSARRAALRSKFDVKPDAPAFQKGTITYHFILE
jgi:colicin import membrane protein